MWLTGVEKCIAGATDVMEPPTCDFLKWDGELFDPKPYRAKSGREYSKNKPR